MSDTTYAGTGFMPPAVMTPDDSQDLTVDMFNYAVFDSEVNQTTIVEKTGVFVLTQDNITVTNSVIDTESFVGNNQLLQGPKRQHITLQSTARMFLAVQRLLQQQIL